ncbi:tRNA pseudouridine(55) synthase TruB [Candidatus Gracilibacteria bacterium]|nr:tRNA pseudouridine(55) synthase TruB [Candidatus Gracilibacteria bacterium]
MSNYNFPEGEVFLIDKPKGWTSFDVIRKLQKITKYRKFGHAGTLDPLATGILIVCSGKKTKSINDFQEMRKEYEVEFYLGGQTATYDSEMLPVHYKNPTDISIKQIQEAINRSFLGKIQQTPPVFSAIKVNGQRAYEAARNGKKIILKSREVEVFSFDLKKRTQEELVSFDNGEKYSLPIYKASIECSKGTYIRSLINDLGENLGVGGYIKELRRVSIGSYSVKDAVSFEELVI